MPELSNPRAERVKALRALSGRSARRRAGRFLVEGPQSVREAVLAAAAGTARLHDLVLTQEAAARYPEIPAAAAAAGIALRTGTREVLGAVSPDAQGVVATADLLAPTLADVVAARPRLVAVLAQVRDPGNAGAVIRTADAAGADAVVLTDGSVDPHNPKTVRATAGSLFHLPVVSDADLAGATAALRGAGLTVLAADGHGDLDLDDLLDVAGRPAPGVPDLAAPTAWLFGNEAWGLPEADRATADAVVRVPLRGRAESLNLATAAAVCLYASSRAQR